jgi:hypothetical protein
MGLEGCIVGDRPPPSGDAAKVLSELRGSWNGAG